MGTILTERPGAHAALHSRGSTTHGIDLLQPKDGEPVEADVITFAWKSETGAASYRLQLAQDATFQHLCCDVPVGEANSLALHAAFAEIGKTYYWRVGAEHEAGRLAWSPVAQFKTATEGEVQTYHSSAKAAASTAAPAATKKHAGQRAAEAAPITPHRTGTTTPREAAAVFSVMVISFALTLAILMYLGASMPG